MIFLPLLSEVIGRTLIVTSKNSNFMMVCCIMMDYYKYRKALCNFNFSKLNTTHWLLAILDSTRLWSYYFMIISGHNLEVHEGICGLMWCLCSCKKSLSSPSWKFSSIIDPYFIMVLNLHGFHHGSSMI
jgi:hypothetical protein